MADTLDLYTIRERRELASKMVNGLHWARVVNPGMASHYASDVGLLLDEVDRLRKARYIMVTRKWSPNYDPDSGKWCVGDWKTGIAWVTASDPFDALIEAETWWQEHGQRIFGEETKHG